MACERRNPLTRNGSARADRYLPAIDGAHFRIDERDSADLLLFARDYARQIGYYNEFNERDGDWSPFFAADLSAVLAALAKLPVDEFVQFASRLRLALLAPPEGTLPASMASHVRLYMTLPLLLLRMAGESCAELRPAHPARVALARLVLEGEAALNQLTATYKALTSAGLIQDAPFDLGDGGADESLRTDPLVLIPDSIRGELARFETSYAAADIAPALLERLSATDWAALVAGTAADPTPLDGFTNARDQIREVLNYGLFVNSYSRLYQLLHRASELGASGLAASLESDATHAPHMGLFLAFIRLFELHRHELNGITERHLRYYYRDILALAPRQAEPDHLHVVFEPARGAEPKLLEGGTRLDAGKDADGKPLDYALDTDIVVNRAAVAELRALQRIGGLSFASPVVNSADGAGGKLPKDYPAWKPFGPGTAASRGRSGFAIADKALLLRDGGRTITIRAAFAELPGSVGSDLFDVSLTGEEGWFEPATVSVTAESGNVLEITIELAGDEPAVVPYDEAVHADELGTALPAARLTLAGPDVLSELTLEGVTLSVDVDNSLSFSLQNDAGNLDPSKPFLPFGAAPTTSSAMILGSPELFAKRLSELEIRVTHETAFYEPHNFLSSAASSYNLGVSCLTKGRWSDLDDVPLFKVTGPVTTTQNFAISQSAYTEAQQYLGNEKSYAAKEKRYTGKSGGKGHAALSKIGEASIRSTFRITPLAGLPADGPVAVENTPYGPGSTGGYLRLGLRQDFGHSRYAAELSRVVVLKGTTGGTVDRKSAFNYDNADLPYQPFTPKFTEIFVDYTTEESEPAELIHLHTFGVTAAPDDGGLLPRGRFDGELYIGLSGVEPPDKVNLLFRLVEGTSNPLRDPASLQWHCLSGDDWLPLTSSAVHDDTLSLTTTGVVGLGIPAGATTSHRLLPSGLVWIRLAVAGPADALCDIVDVVAQGAKATLAGTGIGASSGTATLPAESITKLRQRESAIKKVMQPDPSFGGRAPESDASFVTRTSERLRHKDRAVTIWDYERLVLEAFPEVHRVKCINHTAVRLVGETGKSEAHGIQPGHVLIVPLARIGGKATDPRRPYTRKSTLIRIDRFLRERASAFVKLDVRNPKITEVQVRLTPVFRDEILDIGFYENRIIDEIRSYFMPWAREGGPEPEFGGRWYKAALIDFIEDLPYVDHVRDVEMYHRPDITVPDTDWPRVDVEVIELAEPHAVLVSHETHDVAAERVK